MRPSKDAQVLIIAQEAQVERMVSKKIGLAGKSGSGKDVVADYICQQYGYKKIAVADAIRDECSEFLVQALVTQGGKSLREAEFKGDADFLLVVDAFVKMIHEKPTPSGIRVLLQWWGTEFRRSQDSLYWVKRLQERLQEHEFVVISDVRTPDEMKAIREAGGEIWFVERPGVGSVGITNHYTEVALEGATFDRTIHNDGTLADLEAKVNWIFHQC